MSKKQIAFLAVIALADICVLCMGGYIVWSDLAALRAVTPSAIQAAAASPTPPTSQTAASSPTPPTSQTAASSPKPTETATAAPASGSTMPAPTETHWPTWTPRPSKTPYPTNTPTPTQTPTITPTPTRRSTSTPRPTATTESTGGGGSGGGPRVPGNVIRCGTPNGRPTNGKLDANFSIISWRTAPDDPTRAIGTLEILASGGGDCYKYSFIGKDYDYEPIEFEMGKCGSQTVELIVTSADGQVWKQTWILAADDPGFRCK